MKIIKAAAVLFVLSAPITDVAAAGLGTLPFSGAASPVIGFQTLPIGAGGFIQGMSIAADGTIVIRTDTYGAHIGCGFTNIPSSCTTSTSPIGTSNTWQQLVSASSMPADYVNMSPGFANHGVYEIQVCYSNSQIMYMMTVDVEAGDMIGSGGGNSTVFKSINQGQTWTRTGFTPIPSGNAQANGTNKQWGPKIAIDSSNCNHVYVGTAGSGLFLTTTGGASFSAVSTSTIPAATGSGGFSCMLIARYNPSIIYIGSNGNGIYESVNGDAGPFTQISSGSTGPSDTNLTNCGIDEASGSHQGVLYTLDVTNDLLWVFASGSWSNTLSNIGAFAVDPNNSGHVVGSNFAFHAANPTFETLNAGGSWVTSNTQTVGGDIGWIANQGSAAVTPWAVFDRSIANKVYFASEQGPWVLSYSGNLTSGTSVAYNVMGRGVEQIVGIDVIAPNAGSGGLACPIIPAGWDFQAKCTTNFTTYPTTYYPNFPQFAAIWSTDVATADSSNRILMLADGVYGGGTQQSAYSDNGGTIWTSIVSNLPANENFGGTIAASTNDNWIFYTTNVRQPYYTLNAGLAWNSINFEALNNTPNTYTVSSGTYNSSTGVVALTLSTTPGFTSGASITVFNLTGTGSNLNNLSGTYTVSSVVGSVVSFTGPTGQGTITITGGQISGWLGLGSPYNIPSRAIVCDRVTQNQCTMMLGSGPNVGFYETTNGGAAWSSLGNSNSVAVGNGQMRSIPTQPNDIWLASGQGSSGSGIGNITNGYLAWTHNAGLAWTKVANMGQCYSVGVGAAGASYPNIIDACWLKLPSTTSVSSGTGTKTITITGAPGHTILAGAPVLIDSPGNNWDMSGSVTSYVGGVLTTNVTTVLQGSGSESTINVYVWGEYITTSGQITAPIWTALDGLPGGSLDLVQGISGDMNNLNRAYMAFGGSGFKKINWLLNRDLDPTSNDNSPMWLEKAA